MVRLESGKGTIADDGPQCEWMSAALTRVWPGIINKMVQEIQSHLPVPKGCAYGAVPLIFSGFPGEDEIAVLPACGLTQ